MIGDKVLNKNIVEFIFVVDNVPGSVSAFAICVDVLAELLVLIIGAVSVIACFVELVVLKNNSLNIVLAIFVGEDYFYPSLIGLQEFDQGHYLLTSYKIPCFLQKLLTFSIASFSKSSLVIYPSGILPVIAGFSNSTPSGSLLSSFNMRLPLRVESSIFTV